MRTTRLSQRPGSIGLLCTDGASRTTAELRRGLRAASNTQRTVVATVVRPAWPVDHVAGVDVTTAEPELTLPADRRREDAHRGAEALKMLEDTCMQLELGDVEMVVLHSAEPAQALCQLARSLPASVIIVGSYERSRVKRALFGSVTHQLLREAPCPIIIGAHGATDSAARDSMRSIHSGRAASQPRARPASKRPDQATHTAPAPAAATNAGELARLGAELAASSDHQGAGSPPLSPGPSSAR